MRTHRGFAADFEASLEDFTRRFILWYRNFQRVHREHLLNSPAPPARPMPTIEVSWGELIDKITILEIKEQRLTSPVAVANVRKELAALVRALAGLDPAPAALDGLKRDLKALNETLWDIENRTRAKEAAKTFDQEFIELTRSVYLNNDKRAGIKRRINELLNSGLIEEKQYTSYGR
jgi:post-segregation antitoxin (ccd killing protein)